LEHTVAGFFVHLNKRAVFLLQKALEGFGIVPAKAPAYLVMTL